jgi:peroxiredoxin Q/BCP
MKSEAGRALVRLRILITSAWSAVRGIRGWLAHRHQSEPAPVALQPGDPAPDFELPGSDGHVYRLGDFRGLESVVLAWFPKAFTSGCAAQCRSLEAAGDRIRSSGARHFGANLDRPGTNREFAEALGLGYPILSDVDGRVARAYGVLGSGTFPSRWTFFIGEDGRIKAIDKNVRVLSHGRDVVTRLGELT